MKNYILLLATVLSLGLYSCSEDWISDVVPTDKDESDVAIRTLKDGQNAVNGVLSIMQHEDYYGAEYLVYGDLKGTDVRSTEINKRNDGMYRYNETTESGNSVMWTKPYVSLVSVNNAIDNLGNIVVTSNKDIARKAEVEANLYALRALNHFDLLKVFSRIPASVTGDLTKELGVILADHVILKEETPLRANLEDSYKLVISDLKKALQIMPADLKTAGWLNKSAIQALLARVYLFNGDNQLAYDMAKGIIDAGDYSLVPYGHYSLSWTNDYVNPEALFTLINTEEDNPSREGIGYLWHTEGYNAMAITDSFTDMVFTNASDDRNSAMYKDVIKNKDGSVKDINYLSTKYPDQTANKLHLIRLSEMYFIAAEAIYKVSAANAAEAATLINTVLRARTDVANTLVAGDIDIDRIILENRIEFIAEGKSFFDLMRNKKDVVRTGDDHLNVAPMTIKYDDFKTIQPIPRIELNSNETIQQNPGYAK